MQAPLILRGLVQGKLIPVVITGVLRRLFSVVTSLEVTSPN